jgi:hypothetical protein
MVKNTKNNYLSKNLIKGGTNYLDNIMKGGDLAYKIQRTEKLLDSFNATNNGVIYTSQKIHKGGTDKPPLNTCAIFGYSDDTLGICAIKTLVNDITHLKHFITDLNKNDANSKIDKNYLYCYFKTRGSCIDVSSRNMDDILLEYYYRNRKFPESNNYFRATTDDILGANLREYIDTNSQYITQINKLKYDTHGKYKISALKRVGSSYSQNDDKQEGENEYEQDFSHTTYNKDIVQAYEKKFIDNIQHLPTFMENQYKYLKSMTIANKIIINDYTKKSCFHFYSAYASKMIKPDDIKIYISNKDGAWVNEYTTNYDDKHNDNINKFCFGDSFFKQIFDVIGKDRFNTTIKSAFESDEKWENYIDVESINEYWEFLANNDIERAEPNSKSIFTILENREWDEVMRIFIKDIDNIIAGAPECENDIYCYRAVSFDYISLSDKDDVINTNSLAIYRINEGTYINTRIGSFSLNFDSSEKYLGVDQALNKKTGTMYRAVISKGVKVLYIPSLSYASDEFEILHASHALFLDKQENYKCYNNKKNKYGILSYETDQFNSAIVGLAGYTRTITSNTFEDIANILKTTLKDVRAKNSRSIKNIYAKHLDHMRKSKAADEKITTTIIDKDTPEHKYKNDYIAAVNLKDDEGELDDDVEALRKYTEHLESSRKQGGTRRRNKYVKN